MASITTAPTAPAAPSNNGQTAQQWRGTSAPEDDYDSRVKIRDAGMEPSQPCEGCGTPVRPHWSRRCSACYDALQASAR